MLLSCLLRLELHKPGLKTGCHVALAAAVVRLRSSWSRMLRQARCCSAMLLCAAALLVLRIA
jgi:hypothetical protein